MQRKRRAIDLETDLRKLSAPTLARAVKEAYARRRRARELARDEHPKPTHKPHRR